MKPENFLFELDDLNSDIKVIDFGLSKIVKTQQFGEQGGFGTQNKARTDKKDVEKRSWRETTVSSATYGVLDASCTSYYAAIHPFMATTIKKSCRWYRRESLISTERNGMKSAGRPKV